MMIETPYGIELPSKTLPAFSYFKVLAVMSLTRMCFLLNKNHLLCLHLMFSKHLRLIFILQNQVISNVGCYMHLEKKIIKQKKCFACTTQNGKLQKKYEKKLC